MKLNNLFLIATLYCVAVVQVFYLGVIGYDYLSTITLTLCTQAFLSVLLLEIKFLGVSSFGQLGRPERYLLLVLGVSLVPLFYVSS